MNKLMTVGMAAVFAAGFASAQDGVVMVGQAPAYNTASGPEATVEAALMSSYVWRGQVQNQDPVFQPQFTVSQYNFSFNVWANYDFGSNYKGVDNDLSEIDLTLAYTFPMDLNDMSFDIGAISYQFPANGRTKNPIVNAGLDGEGLGANSKSTLELYAAAHFLTFKDYVIPSITYFGDVKEVNGSYILFDIAAPYQISDYLAVEGGASAGWGDARYNSAYWNVDEKGFGDFNFYANVSYEVMENVTASANLTYTMLAGGAIEDNARNIYEAKEKFWGGVNIAYDF
jgi:hypothetical protein